jgi:hypothetical protein
MGADVSNQYKQLSSISLTAIRYFLLVTALACLGTASLAQRLNDPQQYPSPEVDSATRVREIPAGRIDGWNVTFSVQHTPADRSADTFQLYRNGVRLIDGIDYRVQGPKITMSEQQVPQPGDQLVAIYSSDRSQTLSTPKRGPGTSRQYGSEISIAASRTALEDEAHLTRIGTETPASERNARPSIRRRRGRLSMGNENEEADGVDGLGDEPNEPSAPLSMEGRFRAQSRNSNQYSSLEMLQRSLYERGYDAASIEGDPRPTHLGRPTRRAIRHSRPQESAVSRLERRSLETSWNN